MLEIRKLRYFIAVAEELHFGRAALRLHMSQPPLSRHIKALEHMLDVQLFTRSSQGVELTTEGQTLLAEAKKIIRLSDRAVELTQQAKRGEIGRLEVAYYGTAIFQILPNLLKKFKDRFPTIALSLHNLNKDDQLQAIRDHQIHIGFNRYIVEAPDLETQTIVSERLFVALSDEMAPPGEKAIELSTVAGWPLVLFPIGPRPSFADQIIKVFGDAGLTPTIAQEAEDAISAIALVGAGFGVTLVPQSATCLQLPHVVYRPLASSAPSTDLLCVYLAANRPPVLNAFVEFLREQAGQD